MLNTCCIRENADNKLYGTLGHLKSVKDRRPGLEIIVAGLPGPEGPRPDPGRAGHVDVVLGTHNVHRAVELLARRTSSTGPSPRSGKRPCPSEAEAFPSALPVRRAEGWAAWVTIQIGCDNYCAFCIVPVGARPRDQPAVR